MPRILVLLLAGLGIAQAHDIITTKITWTREMSRLLFSRCAMCHREGGAAFSLMTYDEARPWAKAIKEEVLSRRMPPWQAVKGFGEFRDDRGLTQEDLETISAWVEGGAPEGDAKFLPAIPKPVDWQDPAAPEGASELSASNGARIAASGRLVGIRVKTANAGASIQAIATRPDGTSEPLLWIYEYNPKFARTYYYETPVTLPAGTKIEISPPDAATLGLFTENAVKAKR